MCAETLCTGAVDKGEWKGVRVTDAGVLEDTPLAYSSARQLRQVSANLDELSAPRTSTIEFALSTRSPTPCTIRS